MGMSEIPSISGSLCVAPASPYRRDSVPPCESSLSQDPNSGDFQARRIEPSLKSTTA